MSKPEAPENRRPEERRREPRYEVASGTMTIGTGSYACLDWSRTGFRVDAAPEGPASALPEPGQEFEFGLRIVAAMGRISIKGRGKIVRLTPDFIAGTWDIKDPDGPNAVLASTILQAFMDAGPGGA
jgi:hypothetical protein